jgi:hypothetical protein
MRVGGVYASLWIGDILMSDAPETELLSIFDLEPDAEFEALKDAEAEADYSDGRVLPHDKVAAWLDKLAKGENLPPPAIA